MKIDCVLTASNLNPLYCEFIPTFIKMWNKLVPEADVIIILIANEIPPKYLKYSKNIILFHPLEGVKTEFISQYIRCLYPSILKYSGGILITDMDMLPMNRSYYVDNIAQIPDSKFIYFRDVLLDDQQIAICYNIATPTTWRQVSNISTLEGITSRLLERYSQISYDGIHGGYGWATDQLDLYKNLMTWGLESNHFISLQDHTSGFRRLDRSEMPQFSEHEKLLIQSGGYSDYHALRPFSSFENENEEICHLILNSNHLTK